jgi:hypothetical protein
MFEFPDGFEEQTLQARLVLRKFVEQSQLGACGRFLGIDTGFADFHAPQFPARHGQVFDQFPLGGGAGLPFGFHSRAELLELLDVFAGQDDGVRTQAVTQTVQPDHGFSLRGSGPGGPQRVAAIGFDLFLCCHRFPYAFLM